MSARSISSTKGHRAQSTLSFSFLLFPSFFFILPAHPSRSSASLVLWLFLSLCVLVLFERALGVQARECQLMMKLSALLAQLTQLKTKGLFKNPKKRGGRRYIIRRQWSEGQWPEKRRGQRSSNRSICKHIHTARWMTLCLVLLSLSFPSPPQLMILQFLCKTIFSICTPNFGLLCFLSLCPSWESFNWSGTHTHQSGKW